MFILTLFHRSVLPESFVVCRNFALPENYEPNLLNPILHNTKFDWNNLKGTNRYIVPFMCCGDLSAFDSDKGDLLKVLSKSSHVVKLHPFFRQLFQFVSTLD